MLALQDDEEPRLFTALWPFQLLILLESASEDIWQRKRAVTVPFSSYPDAAVAEDDVTDLELKDFARAQSRREA